MGSFWLFLHGDRAWIHLIEGRCFTARNPSTSETSKVVVKFQDDVRNIHRIPLRNTVSREQGLAAMRCWMPHGERLADLQWVEEERRPS